MKNKIKLGLGVLASLVLLMPLASAFGITTQYWDDNPLEMYAGQTKDITLQLQNMIGDEDIALEAEITQGADIATITDRDATYSVPFGTKDVVVNIRISVPEDAGINGEYPIGVTFSQAETEGDGMVRMTPSISKTVPVIIKSENAVRAKEISPTAGAAVSDIEGVSTTFFLLAIFLVITIVFIVAARLRRQ